MKSTLFAVYVTKRGNEAMRVFQTGTDSFRYAGKAGAGCGSRASLRAALAATLPKLVLSEGEAI